MLAGLAVVMGAWFADVTRIPFDWLWAYTPFLYLPAWLTLVVAAVFGSRPLVAGAVLVSVMHLVVLWPAITGQERPGEPADLRVASANVLYRSPLITHDAREILAADADVVVLQEVTPLVWERIEPVLAPSYPYVTTNLRDDPLGAAILSRLPMRDEEVLLAHDRPVLSAVVTVDGTDVRVWDVHTTAPSTRHGRATRDEMLADMARLAVVEPLPLLAVGDYNASSWHPAFDDFVDDAGLLDAHDAVGRGLAGSWKTLRVEALIDHVVVSREWRVLRVREGEGLGSDHRPVIADLALD